MNEDFVIKDFEEFVLKTRTLVYNLFLQNTQDQSYIDIMFQQIATQDQEEFNIVISQEEARSIVKQIARKQINRKTKETRYVISDSSYVEILENINARMVSNILNSLVNKGLLESGYDSETNDFIFWVKDEHKKNIKKIIEKPETD